MRKRRVLLIASQSEEAEKLKRVLEEYGYQTGTAATSGEAVKLAGKWLPDVAILEIQSPVRDGLPVLQSLKDRGTTSNIPIILLLENFDEDDLARSLKAGAADYLIKPVQTEEVLRRVGLHARIRQHELLRRDMLSRFRELFHDREQVLFLSARDGRLLDADEALVRRLGYDSKEELLGLNIQEDLCWDPNERKRFQKMIERQGLVKNFTMNLRRKDGQKITMLVNAQMVRNDQGDIICYAGSSIEMSGEVKSVDVPAGHSEEQGFIARFLNRLRRRVWFLRQKNELIAQRYAKVERLGLGSFGEIWKVRDIERQGRAPHYVAKIAKSRNLGAQFRKEAAICRQLQDHPNAVKIIDVVEDRDRLVLVQEYVEGPTLKECMDRTLEEVQKEKILSQLVDIVAHAHRHRIAHRDIKPENIIVRHDGTVKLLDYGVAKELKDQDFSSTLVGSRRYMAPEQIMGKSQIASDVWALGVIMYELYTEYPPFFDDNEKALMDLILTREPDPPREIESDISVEMEEIILKCLRKDPGERFADAAALKKALLERFPDFGSR
ncbi:MAG: protein kinase domain-containing protein [Syntrophobacteria bacterium]